MIEASEAPPAIETTLDMLWSCSTVILVGLALGKGVSVEIFEFVRRQTDIRESCRFADTYPAAILLLTVNEVDASETNDFETSHDVTEETEYTRTIERELSSW